MNMNKFFARGSMALGAMLIFALPALPDNLSFGFSNSCGTTTTCVTGVGLGVVNSADAMTGFVGTLASLTSTSGTGTGGGTDILTAGSNTYLELTSTTAGNGHQDMFVLTGTLSCSTCNGGLGFSVSGSNLLTIIENVSTSTGTGANSVVTFGAVTSLSVSSTTSTTGNTSATLASLLGIGATNTAVTSGTDQLTAAGAGYTTPSTAPYTTYGATTGVASETYALNSVTTVTPEPASFLLFGAGLICAGLVSRRRIGQKS